MRGRTARETLNEWRWREGLGLNEVVVYVLDRLRPAAIRAISGESILALGRRTFETEGATIPYHRIVRIEARGAVVFERSGQGSTRRRTSPPP